MKYIFMDTNSVNEDGSYYIWDEDVKSKHLKAGDAVIATATRAAAPIK